MKNHRYLLIGILLFTSISEIYGCVCCASSHTFCGNISSGEEKLALITGLRLGIHPPQQEYMLVKVIEDLNDNISSDTLEILGNDGTACPPVIRLDVGDTIVANLHETIHNGEIAYVMNICGISSLSYYQDSLYGSIVPFVNKMSYTDFKENLGTCESSAGYLSLPGRITNWKDQNEGVSALKLELDNGEQVIETKDDGSIWIPFREIDERNRINFELSSNEQLNRGLSTTDIIKIRRHLLAHEAFISPWEKIAADVNNSETITTIDIIILQKVIVGQLENFIDNDSWRFVRRDYEFPRPDNPWYEEFDAKWQLDLCGRLRADMIAIKIGDVDCSYVDDL